VPEPGEPPQPGPVVRGPAGLAGACDEGPLPADFGYNLQEWNWGTALMVLAGLQSIPDTLYEAARVDGADLWQEIRFVMLPQLRLVLISVSLILTIWGFNGITIIYAMTRGGPVNATHLMATLSYQRAIIAGQLGEGAAISSAMIPFLLAAIMVSWFGLQRRKWQQGENND
jgi:multiple sugar transport system permease protein